MRITPLHGHKKQLCHLSGIAVDGRQCIHEHLTCHARHAKADN